MNIKKIIKEKVLPLEANRNALKIYFNQLLTNALSRGALASSTRMIDPTFTKTWEFSAFSQNGEDGIIDYLLARLQQSNKYFVEIGTGNGLENNTSYLAHVKKFAGLQIEGNSQLHQEAQFTKPWLVDTLNCFVNTEQTTDLIKEILLPDPDIFSIDIDGMDYYIMRDFLKEGLRPKIIIVEYNSAFGAEKSITLPYKEGFDMFLTPFPYLYYGVSLSGWRNLFKGYGYNFLTVESNGINAFFIDRNYFDRQFIREVKGIEFAENIHQFRTFKETFARQFELMKELPFVEISI